MFQTNFRLVKHCLSDTDIWIELVICLPSADKGSKASKEKMKNIFFFPTGMSYGAFSSCLY